MNTCQDCKHAKIKGAAHKWQCANLKAPPCPVSGSHWRTCIDVRHHECRGEWWEKK